MAAPRRRAGLAAAALLPLLAGAPGFAATRTITTTYAYNADGAPTAVTARAGGPATTSYLTWDNFTPDAAAPARGTVSAADGNLLGLGASPGGPPQFAYDVRDRLTACSSGGQPATRYAYHPASLMKSSTLASGDALQFYYDNGATPRMINTVQPSTGAAASFLGPVRYVSDGSEQVLFTPRKDVAGVYDADAQSLAPYSFEPYGASERASRPRSQGYDLADNPFLYAGEYRDPSCDAYYLRHRWYLAAHQVFISRDPADPLHRYGYTAGNPVGRVDPSGLRYDGADFSRDVGKLMHTLEPGAWGYVEPLVPLWGQYLGVWQMAGMLPSFFHHPTTQGYVTLGFLSLAIVAEGYEQGSTGLDRIARFAPANAFRTRLATDAVLGGAQSLAQSYRRGPFRGRIDVAALGQGLETTTAGIFWARMAGGIGYRPFSMTGDDAADALWSEFGVARGRADERILVFRMRETLPGSFSRHTSPLLEALHGAGYHEAILAVGRHAAYATELTEDPQLASARSDAIGWSTTAKALRDTAQAERDFGSPPTEYGFAGMVSDSAPNRARLAANPLRYPAHFADVAGDLPAELAPVTGIGNVSQRHAYAVRRSLGVR